MSNLNVFLNPAQVENETVVVSKRFLDEQGTPVPFVIRPITQRENDLLVRQSTRAVKVNGQPVEKLSAAIMALSGLEDDLEEQAKN